jgi:hypothetical protein
VRAAIEVVRLDADAAERARVAEQERRRLASLESLKVAEADARLKTEADVAYAARAAAEHRCGQCLSTHD